MFPESKLEVEAHPDLNRDVSTSSTIGAIVFIYKQKNFLCSRKVKLDVEAHPDLNRDVPTSSTTGAIIQKKNPPAKTDGLMSGRPGSNRPPRPWQGRALPNELLPLVYLTNKRTRGLQK